MFDAVCYSSINKGGNMTNQLMHDDVKKAYEHIKRIIDAKLIQYDVKYTSQDVAPNTYKAMRLYRELLGQFVVFDGGDHGFLGEEYNIKFRAMHDFMHYTHRLSFSFKDEKELSRLTQWEFMQYAYNRMGLTQWETYCIGQVIKAEIQGQIEYYEENDQYVADQSSFVLEYLGVA